MNDCTNAVVQMFPIELNSYFVVFVRTSRKLKCTMYTDKWLKICNCRVNYPCSETIPITTFRKSPNLIISPKDRYSVM